MTLLRIDREEYATPVGTVLCVAVVPLAAPHDFPMLLTVGQDIVGVGMQLAPPCLKKQAIATCATHGPFSTGIHPKMLGDVNL